MEHQDQEAAMDDIVGGSLWLPCEEETVGAREETGRTNERLLYKSWERG